MKYLDWEVYSKVFEETVEQHQNDLMHSISSGLKDHIHSMIYWSLEDMIPLIDWEKNEFTLRMGYRCSVDTDDNRNILFDLNKKLEDFNEDGDFERIDRIKEIFSYSLLLINKKIKEFEDKGWDRNDNAKT